MTPKRRPPSVAAKLLLLVVPLLIMELLLRLLGYGGSVPLFVDSPDRPGYLEANPEVITRFYRQAPELAIDPIPFRAERLEDSQRIVVQGASTAAGFPYGRWAGLAGMLGDRLEATFPGREIETLTTAMAAVNSYTQLDFVDEIIAIEPDAVLIYLGHNEYLGILGVGSSLTGAGARAVTLLRMKLRSLGLYELAEQLVSSVRGGWGQERDETSGTLMAHAASSASIPFGSDVYLRGIEQFEANLSRMLAAYAEAGIPVYLATLASNESDLAPFQGAGGSEDAADVWFARGLEARAQGRFEEARAAFLAAKDRDALRFRAPEAFNDVIRALAQRYGATLVDVQARLAGASPGGLIGASLMLEHVHPNAEGYFLLADAFYEAMRANGAIGNWSAAPDLEAARRDMPVTAIDRLVAAYTIRQMKADYPFSRVPVSIRPPNPKDEVGRLAVQRYMGTIDWLPSMEALFEIHMRAGQVDAAAVVARMVAQAFPTVREASYSVGVFYARQGQWLRARHYLARSLALAPEDAATLVALAKVELRRGDAVAARGYVEKLSEVAPGHRALADLEGQL